MGDLEWDPLCLCQGAQCHHVCTVYASCVDRPVDVRPSLMKTLNDLQLQYLDLYLIHWPYGFEPGDDPFPKNEDGTVCYDTVSYMETWGVMEQLVEEGLTRHIGLSNFNSKQVDEVSMTDSLQTGSGEPVQHEVALMAQAV